MTEKLTEFKVDAVKLKENPDEAVKDIQNAVDEMASAVLGYKEEVDKLKLIADDFQRIAAENGKANLSMVETIKNIHSLLGQKKGIWMGDKEIEELQNELGKFIMSSGAIKAGVISNESN